MSQSRERIIPIQLEDSNSNDSENVIEDSQETQELSDSQQAMTKSLEQLSVESTPTPKKPNVQIKNAKKNEEYLKEYDVMEKREGNTLLSEYDLPNSNCPEKIILVIDRAQDENYTPFLVGASQFKNPLQMLKRAVNIFVTLKHNIDSRHEFAVVVLNANDTRLALNFTSDIRKIKETVNKISECETEDIFDLESLFDLITENHLPETFAPELAPTFVMRAVIFWQRSYTLPKLQLNAKTDYYLNNPFFTCDILMTHEPIEEANNCNKIFGVLQNLDKKGTAYFFPVCRDLRRLQKCCARLLAHPLQRPIQKLLKS